MEQRIMVACQRQRANVVNLFQHFREKPPEILPSREYVVYAVPDDRWFTVTSCWHHASTRHLKEHQNNNPHLQRPDDTLIWGETYNGVFSPRGFVRRQTAGGWGNQVEWVFRPGSEVVLREVGHLLCSEPPCIHYLNTLQLTGYVSDE
jgi:hypothetical protein